MKKEVSMVKLVLVILFALSFITIAGVESGITEEYRCMVPGITCKFNDRSDPITVYCSKGNRTWKCYLGPVNTVCKQGSQKRTFGPAFNFTGYEVCSELCRGCETDWMRAR